MTLQKTDMNDQSLLTDDAGRSPRADQGALAQYLGILMSHCLNQNDMMWNRAQLLIAVQGAVIAAGYYLFDHQPALARCALIAGAALTAVVALLAMEDRQDRDVNVALIRDVDHELLARFGFQNHSLRLAGRPRWLRWADGDWILIVVLLAFLAVDVTFAFVGFGVRHSRAEDDSKAAVAAVQRSRQLPSDPRNVNVLGKEKAGR